MLASVEIDMKQVVSLDQQVVEPKKRMVGGRYGWAVHRFPIKGGRTVGETLMREWAQKLEAHCTSPSYLASFLGASK